MARPKIAYVGTGIMGAPMARNLLRAGYQLIVHNRTAAKAEALRADGAKVADSPAAAAADASVIITCVNDSPDVEQAYLGAAGICETIRQGGLAIDMSTVSPVVAQRVASVLEQRGAQFLDAPVSGGEAGAIAGALSIMVGGPADALERARPILSVLGEAIVHCGPHGAGQTTKLCNQIICGLNLLAIAEAITFARKAGIDLDKMLEAVSAGAAGSWMVENLGPRMRDGDLTPGFMIDLQQKDLQLALAAAREHLTPLPGTALVHQLFASNQAAGEGHQGTQALVNTLARLSGQSAPTESALSAP